MYHLKLCKALSCKVGPVEATCKAPDAFTEDKAAADAAVASGYFKLVESGDEQGGDTVPGLAGQLDPDQLEGMALKDLKALATVMGISGKGLDKPGLIKAILAVEAEASSSDGDENEVDFDEGDSEEQTGGEGQ